METYLIVIGRTPTGYSGHCPDVLDCASAGKTVEAVVANMKQGPANFTLKGTGRRRPTDCQLRSRFVSRGHGRILDSDEYFLARRMARTTVDKRKPGKEHSRKAKARRRRRWFLRAHARQTTPAMEIFLGEQLDAVAADASALFLPGAERTLKDLELRGLGHDPNCGPRRPAVGLVLEGHGDHLAGSRRLERFLIRLPSTLPSKTSSVQITGCSPSGARTIVLPKPTECRR